MMLRGLSRGLKTRSLASLGQQNIAVRQLTTVMGRQSRQRVGFSVSNSLKQSIPSMSQCSPSVGRAFSWAIKEEGAPETLEYRVFFNKDSAARSPWHDIPLFADEASNLVNYVNEIPKGSRAKMEIATEEATNPIKQDIKKGKLRYFGYGDIPFNYGCLPQTWEDPNEAHPDTGYNGDNDPIDVVELGADPLSVGAVVPCKVVGAFALIDEGETDWKILAISQSSPLFDKINDSADLEKEIPGAIEGVYDWFKMYKTADGKPENTFAFDGKLLDKEYALKVVDETNQSWKDLRAGKIEPDGLALA